VKWKKEKIVEIEGIINYDEGAIVQKEM